MIKTSVKKPLTVFVAVVLVLMLGFISYTDMTPDLMPNIDMPYAIVTTTYPGASPEKVESEVTKPLERTLGTLENIKNVNSTSNENYSLIALEFEASVNMDSITVDILQKISTVEGSFDSMVGTPTIMKLNPNMLPVMVAALDVDDVDTIELSKFVNDEIIAKLEGIEGVVSVTTNGLVEQTIDIQVSDKRIKDLNKKISNELLGEFDAKESDLNKSESDILSAKSNVEEGQKQLDKAKSEFSEKMAAASGELNTKEKELLEGKIAIKEQIQEIEKQILELSTQKESLTSIRNTILEVESQETSLNNSIKLITEAKTGYSSAKASYDNYSSQIEAINSDTSLTETEKSQALQAIYENQEYKNSIVNVEKYKAVFSAYGITFETADATIEQLNAALIKVQSAKNSINSALAAQGIKVDDISNTLGEIEKGLTTLNSAKTELNNTLTELENGEIQLAQAIQTLEAQKTAGILEFSSNSSTLLVTSANLDAAKFQIEQGRTSFDSAKETALKNADLTKLITKDMVSNILLAENFSMPAGYTQSNGSEYTVTVGDEYENIEDIKNQVLFDLQLDGVNPIYISDIAEVVFADNSDDIYAKVNQNNGIVLSFQKQSTYATAEVSNNIIEKFNEIESEYDNIHFLSLMNQGDYIYMITDSLFESLIFGAIFAILILFLFLKDIRPTIITLCSIPLSILFAIVLMYFSNITINMMSLAGLAISVGMLVDNSVVVIENIYRLKGLGVSSVKAAVSGAKQVCGAIIASTLTTICVFFPIAFTDGLTRELFTDMALTIAYSLIASLIVAVTLVPSMSAKLLKNAEPKENKIVTKITNLYKKLIDKSLRHKFVVIALAVVLLAATCVLSVMKGFIFMPETETNQISITLEMPNNTKFEETKDEADKILDKILSVESVDKVGAMASDNKNVTYYALLKEDAELSGSETAKKINELCENSKGEVTASSSAMSSSMSMITGDGISIKIYGEDMDDLRKTSTDIEKILLKVDGVKEVDNGIGEVSPAVRIKIDKNKAMKKGLTVAQIYSEVSALLKTDIQSTTVTLDSNSYEVNITNGDSEYKSLETLEDLVITVTDSTGEEKKVSLNDIAEIIKTDSPVSITRENQKRMLNLTAQVEDNENITVVTDRAIKALEDYNFASGITFEFDGENEAIMDAIYDLFKMLLIGIALVYLVMVAQFQSLKSPFVVMFTIPLALTGGLGALLICDKEISVVSMMGFVLLCGIIVNNGIVLVDYINQLRIEGMNKREAIIEAGITRIRPIFMTSITTVLGLIVMALGIGSGTDLMQPVAIVCIGGLVYATLLTLFVIPIIYDLMNRKEIKIIDEKELEYTDK